MYAYGKQVGSLNCSYLWGGGGVLAIKNFMQVV